MSDFLSKRTKAGVVNGRLVRLDTGEGEESSHRSRILLDTLAVADWCFDQMLDGSPTAEVRANLRERGLAAVNELHDLLHGEYTHEEIRWQLEYRRERRLEMRD